MTIIEFRGKVIDPSYITNPRLARIFKERVHDGARFLFSYRDNHSERHTDEKVYREYHDHSEYGDHRDHTDSHNDYNDHHTDKPNSWAGNRRDDDTTYGDHFDTYSRHTDKHTDS